MAPKIQRIEKGDRPSAVSKAPLSTSSGLEPLFKGLGGLADVGVTAAAQEEQQEAERLRGILEAKQAITNEVAGARMAGDFEEELVGFAEGLKKQYESNPEKAIDAFIQPARNMADAHQKDAPNGETELDFSRQSGARIQAVTRQLHNWVADRQTQKAKGDLSKLVNIAENKAAGLSTTPELVAHLANTRQRLTPAFEGVYGAEAADKLSALEQRATYAFVDAKSRRDPLAAASLAQAKQGPTFENLNATQRATLLESAKKDYTGLRNTNEFDLAREGVMQYGPIYEAMQGNDPGVGTMVLRKRESEQALLEQVANDQRFKPEDRELLSEVVERRIKILDAMDSANRKAVGYDSEDDFAIKSELIREHDELITGKGINAEIRDERGIIDKYVRGVEGKGMLDILKHQQKLIEARNNGKIRISTYDALHNDLVRVLGVANQGEAANTWHAGRFFIPTRDSREVGNQALNQALEAGTFSELPEDAKISARYKFIEMYNKASEAREPSKEESRQMALQALAIVSKRPVPGAWK